MSKNNEYYILSKHYRCDLDKWEEECVSVNGIQFFIYKDFYDSRKQETTLVRKKSLYAKPKSKNLRDLIC